MVVKGDEMSDVPETIDGYAVVGVLGQGGFGTVYRATDPSLGDVAVKMLRADRISFRERFVEEARAMRDLEADGIARIYSIGPQDAERPYFVMEYCERGTLDERLSKLTPLSLTEGLGLVEAIAAATDQLVIRKKVHRDLKPSNFLIRRVERHGHEQVGRLFAADEQLIISDLGSTKTHNPEATHLTSTVGTPQWAAPEQLRSHGDAIEDTTHPILRAQAGLEADVFAASKIMVFAMSGEEPATSKEPGQQVFSDQALGKTGPLEPALRRGLSFRSYDRQTDLREWAVELRSASTSGNRTTSRLLRLGLSALALAGVAAIYLLINTGTDDLSSGAATTLSEPEAEEPGQTTSTSELVGEEEVETSESTNDAAQTVIGLRCDVDLASFDYGPVYEVIRKVGDCPAQLTAEHQYADFSDFELGRWDTSVYDCWNGNTLVAMWVEVSGGSDLEAGWLPLGEQQRLTDWPVGRPADLYGGPSFDSPIVGTTTHDEVVDSVVRLRFDFPDQLEPSRSGQYHLSGCWQGPDGQPGEGVHFFWND